MAKDNIWVLTSLTDMKEEVKLLTLETTDSLKDEDWDACFELCCGFWLLWFVCFAFPPYSGIAVAVAETKVVLHQLLASV